jgi:hypothetical protein
MRASFDKLISWTGVLLAVALLVAGGLATFAYFYIGNEVEKQFGIQDITMPEGQALQSVPQADRDVLEPYAGSPLDNGPKARAYADHYILAHMNKAANGKTYEEVSGQYITMTDEQKASPAGLQLAGLRTTLFQGNTLRGLLLYGAAFATMGTIAGWAAISAYIGAAILLVLGFLGMRHARQLEHVTVAEPSAASRTPVS